jgi:Leucine-rich repeat (LRR) protein
MRNLKKLDLASNDLSDHSSKPGYFPHSLTSLNLANNHWNSFPLGIVIKGSAKPGRTHCRVVMSYADRGLSW